MVLLNKSEKKDLDKIHEFMSSLHEAVMRRVSPDDEADPKKFADASETIVFNLLDHFGVDATLEGVKTWLVLINRKGKSEEIRDMFELIQSLNK